nr:hypothetical protein [Pandoravirus massiliensis]
MSACEARCFWPIANRTFPFFFFANTTQIRVNEEKKRQTAVPSFFVGGNKRAATPAGPTPKSVPFHSQPKCAGFLRRRVFYGFCRCCQGRFVKDKMAGKADEKAGHLLYHLAWTLVARGHAQARMSPQRARGGRHSARPRKGLCSFFLLQLFCPLVRFLSHKEKKRKKAWPKDRNCTGHDRVGREQLISDYLFFFFCNAATSLFSFEAGPR